MNKLRQLAAYVRMNADVFLLVIVCTVALTAVAGAAGSFTSAGTFFASGPIASSFPKPGLYTSANAGASYFVNQGGGGFVWNRTNAGTGLGTQLMSLDPAGALHVSQVVGNAFTASAWITPPSNCPAGQSPTGTDAAGNALNCRPSTACLSGDDCGELFFNASQNSNTYTFTGTPINGGCAGCYPQHPICTTSASGFQNTYLFVNYGGCGGSPCTLTLRAATVGVTGFGEYICRIRP